MAETLNTGALGSLDKTLFQSGASKKEKNSDIDGQEFIQLLVTQLKQQDPLEPMDNGEFAVQLAQFSQVQELVRINEQLSKANGTDFSSMASFLGTEVTLNSSSVTVNNGHGGSVAFDLPEDAHNVEIRLMGPNGTITEYKDVGDLAKGRHVVELSSLRTQGGEYTVEVSATGVKGGNLKPQVNVAGTVTGFVPGPEPVLLVGDREVSPGEVIRVGQPQGG